MAKCRKGEECIPTHIVEFEDDNYICSGVSKKCTYKYDNIVVCIKGIKGEDRLEMNEKEGLVIAEGILSSIFKNAFHSHYIFEK